MKRLNGELGVIEQVDTTHYTCVVRAENRLYQDVPIAPVFLSPGGQGMWFLPEVGTRVLVGTIGNGTTNEYTFLIGASFAVDQDPLESAEATDDGAEEEVIPVDFRNNRAVHTPGDIVLSSSDRNFMVMRKGGIIELGATQVAKRFYIPLQNVIRDLCQIYEMQNSAGLFQMVRKENDLTWGTESIEIPKEAPDGEKQTETVEVDKVPTEMNLRVKQFESDTVPIVQIDLGNVTRTVIKEEGDLDDSSGGRSHDIMTEKNEENNLAQMIARININNSFKVFIDKNGNYTTECFGAEIHSHQGPRYEDIYRGNYVADFLGNFSARYKAVSEEITHFKKTTAGESVEVAVGTEDSPETTWMLNRQGADLKAAGKVDIKGSKVTAAADGLLELKAGGDVSISCDNLVISTMGTIDHIYAGSVTQTCLNSDVSGVAYRVINESAGEIQIHNSFGEIRLSSMGRPGLGGQAGIGLAGLGSTSQVRIKPNGTISLDFLAGGVTTNSLEVNATGVAMRGAAGAFEISIDAKGHVNVGGPPGSVGNGRVVTTLTHPVCFVTGLPIMGSPTVGAFSGAPAPGPFTPVPPVFVPDPT